MSSAPLDPIGILLGFVLTCMIYSYLLGDNPLYRLAIHILVGVGVGYAFVIVVHGVIYPQLIQPLIRSIAGDPSPTSTIVLPLLWVLVVLLLFKLFPRTAPLGNLTMGFVMGVGAAVAVGGAVLGTLIPQIDATAVSLLPGSAPSILPGMSSLSNVLAVLVVIAGTITSLLYFHFNAVPVSEDEVERPTWVRVSALVGQGFLMIAFGSLYAGALVASLSLLTERLKFLVDAPLAILQQILR
jgi:hypothetical protein